eukprot:15001810-Alexandrium_andersonii.AAC.1
MPVNSLPRTRVPSGFTYSAHRGVTNARTSRRQRIGHPRHSITASIQAGASLSNALLWSMSNTA